MICGTDGKWLNVKLLSVAGKFGKAHEFGVEKEEEPELELSADEQAVVEKVRGIWSGILKSSVENETDFFAAGAGSMDVVRLIEEVKEASGVTLANEDVFMATQFGEFIRMMIIFSRGGGGKKMQEYLKVRMNVNKMDISFPNQLFIDGLFCDVEDDMFLAKEESFGPIMCISKFDAGDVEGVVKRANNTEYGLASGVFTKDVN